MIAGTIFEQSKKPLVLWFRAIFNVTASKQGISAAELHRKLGLGSYQTAWSWLQKIRTATVRSNREPLSGEVEIDESYVGGPEAGKPGRAAEEKAIVASRGGEVRTRLRPVRLGLLTSVSADVLTAFVDSHLGDGETAHTDGWRGYAQLGKTGYRHIVSVLSKLDQTAAEVLPRVHLIFSLLKRWILGTHWRASNTWRVTSRSLPSGSIAARAQRITLGAERLLGIAIMTPPRRSGRSSAGRVPTQNRDSMLPPDDYGDPVGANVRVYGDGKVRPCWPSLRWPPSRSPSADSRVGRLFSQAPSPLES